MDLRLLKTISVHVVVCSFCALSSVALAQILKLVALLNLMMKKFHWKLKVKPDQLILTRLIKHLFKLNSILRKVVNNGY